MNNASHMVAVDFPDASMDMFFQTIGIKHDYFASKLTVRYIANLEEVKQ